MSCGCTDYHLADCPVVTPSFDDYPYDGSYDYDDNPARWAAEEALEADIASGTCCKSGDEDGLRLADYTVPGLWVKLYRWDCSYCGKFARFEVQQERVRNGVLIGNRP